MTREALTEASSVSPSYPSGAERRAGFKRPSTDVLAAIARALWMVSSELLGYVEASSPQRPFAPAAAAMMPSPTTRRSCLTGMSDLASFVPRQPRQEAEPSQDIEPLISVTKELDPADLKVIVELARRQPQDGSRPRTHPAHHHQQKRRPEF